MPVHTPLPVKNDEYPPASDTIIDHDTWNYGLPKLPKGSTIQLSPLHGVLPFDGVRNPSARSNFSQKVFVPYKTAANGWQPKIGIAESAAELGVGLEAEVSPSTYDLHFQPLKVEYRDDDGRRRSYTHDVLVTSRNGHRRLIFVRNRESLQKPQTARQIEAIAAATPKSSADDMIVVSADSYTRQRRDNLIRMHYFFFQQDEEADEILLHVARSGKAFYFMQDLFPYAPVSPARAFAACYRLVARKAFHANLNHVLWEYSKLELAV